MVATWVTPHGCSTADPLKLLRGKRLSGSAKQPCPEVHKALAELSNLTDDESLEAALEKSLGAAEAGRVRLHGLP